MAIVGNWVSENTNTTGVGTITLTGAVDSTLLTFQNVIPSGDVFYSISDGDNREAGIGSFDGNNQLTRNDIHSTKVAGTYSETSPSPISLSGNAVVSVTLNARAFNDFLDTVLDDLSDVNVPSPADGQVLTWDSGNAKWQAETSVTGVTDHDGLTNNGGAGSHTQITNHINDTNIHFSDAPANGQEYVRKDNSWSLSGGDAVWGNITGTLSNQTDLQNELNGKANLSHTHVKSDITDFSDGDYATAAQGVTADSAVQPGDNISVLTNNSGYISNITGESIKDLSDVFSSMVPSDGQVLTFDTTNGWQAETTPAGVTDHDLLSNNGGAGSHTAISSHMSDLSIHYSEASINHANITNIGTNSHATIDAHLASTANPHSTTIDNLDDTVITTPASNDHLVWDGAQWINQAPTSGTTFTELTDTPADYVGSGNYTVRVNQAEDALEFVNVASSGTTEAPYKFNTSVAGTDPGIGKIALDNASPTLVVSAVISQTDDVGNDSSIGFTTVSEGDLIGLNDANTSKFYTYRIEGPGVDLGAYWQFDVSYVNSTGTFANNEALVVEILLVPIKNFIELFDTPAAYTGQAGKHVQVNQAEDGVEFLEISMVNDTSPQLGGDLETQDFDIILQNSLDVEEGRLQLSPSDDVALSRTTAGVYDPEDGGVVCAPGTLEIHGGTTEIINLAGKGDQQVFVSNDGVLYGVDTAQSGFVETDTDNGDYALTVLATWVKLTGLEITIPADVVNGEPLTVRSTLHVINNSTNVGGTIDIGYGINGAAPTGNGVNYNISGDYNNSIPTSLTSTTHGGLTTGDTITVWARRATEDNPTFAPEAHGSTGNDHELFVSDSYSGGGTNDHSQLINLDGDDHTQYSLVDGTRAFTGVVGGVAPTLDAHLSTKLYVDTQIGGISTDHDDLTNNGGAGSHLTISNHMADSSIHYTQGSISITASQVSDFSTAADARIALASIDDLADVIVTTPVSEDVLGWNGTEWVNADLISADLGELGDVTLTVPADGDHLTYDNGSGEWVNTPLAASGEPYFIDSFNGLLPTVGGTDQLVIGEGSSASAAANLSILIGGNITDTTGANVLIGNNILMGGVGSERVAVGNGANVYSTGVAVGTDSSTGGDSAIAVGIDASAPSATSIAIGSAALAPTNGLQIKVNASSTLELSSTGYQSLSGTEAQFVQPNYTTAGLPTGQTGGTVFDTTTSELKVYDGAAWQVVSGGATDLDGLTDVTITTPAVDEVLGYDGAEWVNSTLAIAALDDLSDVVITTPADGDSLTYDSGSGDWINSAGVAGDYQNRLLTLNDQTGTGYTLVLTDADTRWVTSANAAANTVTVPPNSSVAFDIGSQINVNQKGAGQTTIVEGAGVTINTPATLLLRAQWSSITLVKVATDTWTIMGDLEAV